MAKSKSKWSRKQVLVRSYVLERQTLYDGSDEYVVILEYECGEKSSTHFGERVHAYNFLDFARRYRG